MKKATKEPRKGAGNKKGGKEKGGGGAAGSGAVRRHQLLAKLPLALPADHLTRDMSGPTPYSNWVVRGCLLVGAYPLKPYMTEAILKQGVTVFVCLMEESEFGKHGKHYFDVAKSMLDSRPSDFVQKSQELRYVHHPIPDRMVGSDDATLVLVEKILAFLRAGEVVYIHCYGGHGRTGIFASVLLGRIHGIDAEKALQLCKLYHDCRPDVEGISAKSVPSPQTHDQRAQVSGRGGRVEEAQHVLGPGELVGHGPVRLDVEHPHDAVDDVGREAAAAAAHALELLVEPERAGEAAVAVAQHQEALVLGVVALPPGLHHELVVDRNAHHRVDAQPLEVLHPPHILPFPYVCMIYF